MVQITCNIPDKEYEQINNFYIKNYGYTIHTQIQNFIFSEYMKICELPLEDGVGEQPFPRCSFRKKKYYVLDVTYPDGSRSSVTCTTYEEMNQFWMEWSKYGFDKKKKIKVYDKVMKKHPNIRRRNGTYAVVMDTRKGCRFQFGTYKNLEDALLVRDFLIAHDWDMKYHSTQLKKNPNIHQYNYSVYLLQIARGEVEL